MVCFSLNKDQNFGGQFTGALLGGVLVWLAYLAHWKATDGADRKLAVFCTMPAIRKYGCNLLTEIIGTAILLMGVLGIFNIHNSIGLFLGGPTDRVRIESRTSSGPEDRPLDTPNPREEGFRLELSLGSGYRTDHW